jgi:glycosyltransferase involved in cell wall biosynthesis
VSGTRPLSIWLATTGEPLESDGESVPLLQTGRLSKFLARRGHRVIWWTSRFNHRTKAARPSPPAPGPGIPAIRLIDSPGYARNVSVQRVWDHHVLGNNFLAAARRESRPDVILAALPPVDLAAAAVRAGHMHSCPTIVDIRDEWPDLIVDHVSPALRPLARLALSNMNAKARYALANATAVTGITNSYVEWGLEKAGRSRGRHDLPFPISRETFEVEWAESGRDGAKEILDAGVDMRSGDSHVCFVGSLGRQFDLSTVILAARQLRTRNARIKVVIAGSGERHAAYRQEAAGLDNVIFTGHLSRSAIGALLKVSLAGIAPYLDVRNFRDNIPNKIVEYLSGGVPIICPLEGEVAKLIRERHVGVSYAPGSAVELATAITRVCDDRPFRDHCSANAMTLFNERFEANQVHGRLAAYLEDMVAEHRSQGSAA